MAYLKLRDVIRNQLELETTAENLNILTSMRLAGRLRQLHFQGMHRGGCSKTLQLNDKTRWGLAEVQKPIDYVLTARGLNEP